MTIIAATAQTTAAAMAGLLCHHAGRADFAARFETFVRGRCFIRIDRFTGIRILLGSVLDAESADWRAESWSSKAGARGVSDYERPVLSAVATGDYGGRYRIQSVRVSQ